MTEPASKADQPRAHREGEDFDPPGPDWLYRLRQRIAGDSKLRQLIWRDCHHRARRRRTARRDRDAGFPRPGWAAIFLGLAILASEYVWAHRLLRFTKEKAQGAASAAVSRENRKRTIAIARDRGTAHRLFGVVVRVLQRLVARPVPQLVRYRLGRATLGAIPWRLHSGG